MNRDEQAVVYALSAFVAILAFGTAMFSWLEGWGILDSLYFTLYTVTTVGFGDMAPSPENRLFTAAFILVCTTMTIACIAVIGNWIVSALQRRSAANRAGESSERARRAMDFLGGGDAADIDEIERSVVGRIRRLRSRRTVRCPRTAWSPCKTGSRSNRRTSSHRRMRSSSDQSIPGRKGSIWRERGSASEAR